MRLTLPQTVGDIHWFGGMNACGMLCDTEVAARPFAIAGLEKRA
jgi:hypothetical protein